MMIIKQAGKSLRTGVILFLMTAVLCAGTAPAAYAAQEENSLQIVTTIFPVYDWIRNILGENRPDAQVTFLLDNGADLHNYQPTAEDILKISTCDVFIYVGGESDRWVDDALAEAVNPDMVTVNLIQAAGGLAKEEELAEGMEGDASEEEEEEDAPEYDEHIWLSLRIAHKACEAVTDALIQADPVHEEEYTDSLSAYTKQLDALDQQYQETVSAAQVKTLVFGDRFPFRYMTDDYGLDYYAAFSGCSAETEASFETIIFLAGKIDELGLHAIMTIDGSDQRIAQTVAQTAKTKDLQTLVLNSMQSVTRVQAEEGTSYLQIMKENLDVLTAALQA